MRDLDGKLALITGGASGIGLGMARAFVASGMRVVIADWDAEAARSAAAELSATGAFAEPLQLDVRDADAWERAARTIESRFGHLHVLCNNAGVGGGRVELADLPSMLWKQIIDTNLNGVFFGISTYARRMIAHGEGGHVVNTASILGLITTPAAGAYSAAKFAVVSLSETLRAELAPHGIGVSVLCPGVVGTRLNTNTTKLRQAMLPGLPDTFKVSTVLSAGTARRMDPDRVGERVLAGIRANELYILTHPEYEGIIEARFAAVRAALGEATEPGYRDSDEILAAFSGGPYLFGREGGSVE